MGRSVKIVLVGAVIGLATAALAYFGSMRLSARHIAGADDLAWLRREFRLSSDEMERIRQLHEGYLPKCREMCGRIAAKRSELETALADKNGEKDKAEQRLVELGTLRAQCQAQMLRHFEEVSKAMPTEQGKRYLAEMQRLTLGSHQDFESSMEGSTTSEHVHGSH